MAEGGWRKGEDNKGEKMRAIMEGTVATRCMY